MKSLPVILLTMVSVVVIPYMAGGQMDHEKMMESQGMPGSGANECFKHSMEQAIGLHQMHIRDKSTDTKESEKEMMDQMEHARTCLQESGTPGRGGKVSQDKQMQCADDWLDRSIALHRKHMTDPSTKTQASQKQLLNQMRRSYNCTGPSRTISGETEGK